MRVCVCVHAQPTDLRNTVYKGRDHLLIKDDEYQKEIRGIRLNLQGNKQEH